MQRLNPDEPIRVLDTEEINQMQARMMASNLMERVAAGEVLTEEEMEKALKEMDMTAVNEAAEALNAEEARQK